MTGNPPREPQAFERTSAPALRSLARAALFARPPWAGSIGLMIRGMSRRIWVAPARGEGGRKRTIRARLSGAKMTGCSPRKGAWEMVTGSVRTFHRIRTWLGAVDLLLVLGGLAIANAAQASGQAAAAPASRPSIAETASGPATPAPSAVLGTVAIKERPPVLAGKWYPADSAALTAEAWRLLRAASGAPLFKSKPIALVSPHAGWPYSGAVAAAAFHTLRRGDFRRVVIVSPSHHADFEGFATDDATAYLTPLGAVPVCADARKALLESRAIQVVPDVSAKEHSVEIELPFLQKTLGDACIVPIMAGRTTAESEKALATRLASLNDGRTLYLFSSDFTHYGQRFGYLPFGSPVTAVRGKIRDLDQRAIGLLMKIDAAGFREYLKDTDNTICGRSGLTVLLELLPLIAPKAKATLLGYYASADIAGLKDDSSVSYVALAYTSEGPSSGKLIMEPPDYRPVSDDSPPLSEPAGQRLVRLARAALRAQLSGSGDLDRELESFRGDPEFDRKQGVFVTLQRKDPAEIEADGKLRGCVGQVFPVYPIYQAVVEAAVDAAIHDGRFEPVTTRELDRLEVEVTVLSVPKPVASWKEIKLGTHGIVLEKNGRRALFLPQVAPEQGWNIEQTLTALSRKAGLASDAWREGATFSVFTGQVFYERPEKDKPGDKNAPGGRSKGI